MCLTVFGYIYETLRHLKIKQLPVSEIEDITVLQLIK